MDGTEPFDIFELVHRKYDLFNPSDLSEGYADRVAGVLKAMALRRHLISDALVYTPGTHTYDQLVAMVLSGRVVFWALKSSFMITEVHTYPNAKHFHIFLAGGNLEELVAMHEDVLPLARALDCDKLTLAGRTGWQRALQPHGWQPYLLTLAKDI